MGESYAKYWEMRSPYPPVMTPAWKLIFYHKHWTLSPISLTPVSQSCNVLAETTWHGGRPRPRRHCVRWGPSSPTERGTAGPTFRPMSTVVKRSPISATAEFLILFVCLFLVSCMEYMSWFCHLWAAIGAWWQPYRPARWELILL